MPCIAGQNIFGMLNYAAGYHPGPVAPPSADGASLERNPGKEKSPCERFEFRSSVYSDKKSFSSYQGLEQAGEILFPILYFCTLRFL